MATTPRDKCPSHEWKKHHTVRHVLAKVRPKRGLKQTGGQHAGKNGKPKQHTPSSRGRRRIPSGKRRCGHDSNGK
jgi:hypothetical protein